MLTLNDGRSELWQWDTGRKLSVDADCSQVHFSNKVFGRSIDVDVVDGVAIIPDILLQTDKDLTAWAFVGTPENGYTKISKVFKVNRRNKPADYVFTPTDQTTLEELVERLEKIEENQDPDAINKAVDDYLASNPIKIDETDPTVPEWAKQSTKPAYTAQEVGALPNTTIIPTVPTTLPNPYKLTFTGAVVAEYDGGKEVIVEIPEGGGSSDAVLYTEQKLTEEQKAQARDNIGADCALISILETDPVEPKEGQMWILKTAMNKLTTPVIELGAVSENSIEIKLSNAAFDGNGAVVATYNIYLNGELNKTENIAAGGTCVVTGLSPETEYQICVRGVKGSVISDESNVLTATTSKGEVTEQEIVIVTGRFVGAGQNEGAIFNNNPKRAVAVSTSGKLAVSPVIDGVQYYVLEVPNGVTSCTVVCPNMMWGYNGWNIGSDGKLAYDVDSGWQSSGATYQFFVGAAEYVSIAFKKVPETDFVTEDVTGISITFA